MFLDVGARRALAGECMEERYRAERAEDEQLQGREAVVNGRVGRCVRGMKRLCAMWEKWRSRA